MTSSRIRKSGIRFPTWILNIEYWILDILSPLPRFPSFPFLPSPTWILNIEYWILDILPPPLPSLSVQES